MKALLAISAILVLLTSACGRSEGTDTSEADDGGSEAATTLPADLPGTQAFGLTDEEFAEKVEATESLIASCMADAGFEYVPVDVTAILEVEEWLRTAPTMSREEYKSQWGYGISTRFDFPAREVGLGPQNLAIYDELSEADQVAYDRTLFGDDTDATFAITLDDEDFSSTGGCTRSAVEEVFPPEMLAATFVNPKDILVEFDPRVQAAEEEWIDCMQEEGYDYEDQDEIIEEYEERLDVVSEGEDPEELTGARLDALNELQAEEIAVAMRDLECQAPVDEAVRQVEIELYGTPVSG